MAYFTGIMLGFIAAQLIKFVLFCAMLYMLFSPMAMWVYLIACFVYGFIKSLKRNA